MSPVAAVCAGVTIIVNCCKAAATVAQFAVGLGSCLAVLLNAACRPSSRPESSWIAAVTAFQSLIVVVVVVVVPGVPVLVVAGAVCLVGSVVPTLVAGADGCCTCPAVSPAGAVRVSPSSSRQAEVISAATCSSFRPSALGVLTGGCMVAISVVSWCSVAAIASISVVLSVVSSFVGAGSSPGGNPPSAILRQQAVDPDPATLAPAAPLRPTPSPPRRWDHCVADLAAPFHVQRCRSPVERPSRHRSTHHHRLQNISPLTSVWTCPTCSTSSCSPETSASWPSSGHP